MKVGIMQPYFFPYIGYFQLIESVDVYVNLEHVNFMKRSYMVRNLLRGGTQINIPVSNGSQNKTCVEVLPLCDENWFFKFEKTLNHLYKKEKNYTDIIECVVLPWKNKILNKNENLNISQFNFLSIKLICKYLDLKCKFESSIGLTSKKKGEGLKEIVSKFNGTDYINAIGGVRLYKKEDFIENNIKLHFIKMGQLPFDDPYVSILDLLFSYSKKEIKEQLKNYILI